MTELNARNLLEFVRQAIAGEPSVMLQEVLDAWQPRRGDALAENGSRDLGRSRTLSGAIIGASITLQLTGSCIGTGRQGATSRAQAVAYGEFSGC